MRHKSRQHTNVSSDGKLHCSAALSYSFVAFGHPNVRSTHRTTVEFTKSESLTPRGDCIIGVKADFKKKAIIAFLKKAKKKCVKFLVLEISVRNDQTVRYEKIIFEPNYVFADDEEIVIRKTEYVSERTLGLKADKAASDLDRGVVKLLKDQRTRIKAVIRPLG